MLGIYNPFRSPERPPVNPTPGTPLQSERQHRLSVMKNKRTDPVTVVFGRPDICVYLRETFAKETEAPGSRGGPGLDTATPLVDRTASTRDIARSTGRPWRQVSGNDNRHGLYGTGPAPCMSGAFEVGSFFEAYYGRGVQCVF